MLAGSPSPVAGRGLKLFVPLLTLGVTAADTCPQSCISALPYTYTCVPPRKFRKSGPQSCVSAWHSISSLGLVVCSELRQHGDPALILSLLPIGLEPTLVMIQPITGYQQTHHPEPRYPA